MLSDVKTSVLFVCLGNICRSPTGEAVMRRKVQDAGLHKHIQIDSAGTAGYHTGSPPDKRSQSAGIAKGYDFKGIACRRVKDTDFEKFDYILAMDDANYQDLLEVCPLEHQDKVKMLMSFTDSEHAEVPDPYYGGRKGFELVLEMIEAACDGLLNSLKDKHEFANLG